MYWIEKQYPIFIQIQYYVNKEYDISVGLSFANEKLVQLAIFFWKCKICRITRFYDKTKPKGQTDVLKKIKWRWSEVFFIAMVVHCIPNYFHPLYYFTSWKFLFSGKHELSKFHICFNCTLEIFPLTIFTTFYCAPIYIAFPLDQAWEKNSFKAVLLHFHCNLTV